MNHCLIFFKNTGKGWVKSLELSFFCLDIKSLLPIAYRLRVKSLKKREIAGVLQFAICRARVKALFFAIALIFTPWVLANTKRSSPASYAYNTVWRVTNFTETPEGTAFAVGSNLFVTNFSVIRNLIYSPRNSRHIAPISLYNENGQQLSLDKVQRLDAYQNLALFTTKEKVRVFLKIQDVPIHSSDQLILLTSPNEMFRRMQKTTKISNGNVDYDFVNDSANGSPVFNKNWQVVALAFSGGSSIIQSKHIKNLMDKKTGFDCLRHNNLRKCVISEARLSLKRKMIEELNELKKDPELTNEQIFEKMLRGSISETKHYLDRQMAFEILRPLAMKSFSKHDNLGDVFTYVLGQMFFYGDGTALNFDNALFWTIRSANQGHIKAQMALGRIYLYQEDYENAFNLLKSIQEKNLKVQFDQLKNYIQKGDFETAMQKLEELGNLHNQIIDSRETTTHSFSECFMPFGPRRNQN